MKYRLREGKNDLAIYNEDFADIENEIEKNVRKMSRYLSHQKPVLALGSWPGIALWKVKVTFATGVESDMTYKTERVKD
jgi:hypothetical protein